MPPVMKTIALAALLLATAAHAQDTPRPAAETARKTEAANAAPDRGVLFEAESVASNGKVSVRGRTIAYRAVAGTLVVHPKGWDDAAWRETPSKDLEEKKDVKAEAAMFYTAYFAKGAPAANRPIMFLYNGGPGSSTVWLHMGAFGPRRVVTAEDSHTPAAPYRLVDNTHSLLDATDLVFIDAPGTGFSRIAGKDKEKAFFGVDQDAHAFAEFVKAFLSKYGRWNSPKYLFGESYGTPRTAVLANELVTDDSVDLNGLVMLSQILNFDLNSDSPGANPGSDQAYITTLPTMAATAWYHNRIADRPASLEAYLADVERFAQTDYALALQQGADLDPARKAQVADRLAGYLGIPADYILRSDLRLTGGQFSKALQESAGLTTGRLDTRFSGPDLDPMSKEAEYDPQSSAISSAYVSTFNAYARDVLGYGADRTFKPSIDTGKWEMTHKQPGRENTSENGPNMMPDLANAMKQDPGLMVLVAGGYYDLATPFYEGFYEMKHLPMPISLQSNIEYHYYPSGHMIYANEPSLAAFHDAVAAFVAKTSRR